jgi:hypothetical protein
MMTRMLAAVGLLRRTPHSRVPTAYRLGGPRGPARDVLVVSYAGSVVVSKLVRRPASAHVQSQQRY